MCRLILCEKPSVALAIAYCVGATEKVSDGKRFYWQGNGFIVTNALGHLIGEIVASQADDSILTDGKVDLGKLRPIIFDPSFNVYRVVGEAVGNAFRDGLKLKEQS